MEKISVPERRLKPTKKQRLKKKNHESVQQKTKTKKKILAKKPTKAEQKRKAARDAAAAQFGRVSCAECQVAKCKRDFSQTQLLKTAPKCRMCVKVVESEQK
tara:strand:+ start:702 stop:1007 length:306 start_codon:yes stop_codon:yes gene_type:complete